MKRYLPILLSLLLCFTFFACNSNLEDNNKVTMSRIEKIEIGMTQNEAQNTADNRAAAGIDQIFLHDFAVGVAQCL